MSHNKYGGSQGKLEGSSRSVSQYIGSRSVSQYIGSDAEELSDEELIKKVNDLKHQIKILSLENEIFEKTIMRLDPSLMHGIQQALDYAGKLQSNSSLLLGSFAKSQSRFGLIESMNSPSRLLTSPSRASTRRESSGRVGTVVFGAGPRVNVVERSELVANEMEILIQTLERARSKAAKEHALLKAQIEEICVRVKDVERATEMFNQQVIIDGWDKIAHRIPAEIWIRFMTEWVKICDGQIGKLRLRTSTLNAQFIRFKGQVKVKAELSESLRPVDFEKTKIENNEALGLIERKWHQLAELKKMTGDANLNLAVHKKSLMEQNGYLNHVTHMIREKNRLAIELDREREVVNEQVEALAVQLEGVQKVRMAYEVPDVMEYVKVKAEVADLRHGINVLENRLRVQLIALKSLNKKLQSMFFYE